jgi:NAD(P)-dependent dehydrogenase (short-subunit alcohol dehydrogenase family)
MSLENRVAVISGATGVLGALMAGELTKRGASLALLDIDAGRLDALALSLALPASRLLTRKVNLLDPAETQAAAEIVGAHFNRLDILLHLVGGWTGGKSLLETSPDDLVFMLNQHIWTSFNVTRAFLPQLVSNGWGRIVMITSPYAARPSAKGGPYAIGKAGQEALMLTLAQELKGTGVTANLLQAKAIDARREKISNPSPENASSTTPEELANGILFLLTEDAGTVNGAKIPLYGSNN